MPEVITAIYENGILRPLIPLPLREHQTIQIQILPFRHADATEEAIQVLINAGLLTPPQVESDIEPISAEERRTLAEVLGKATGTKPLSEIIIEERGEW
jgi:predicted DNA-binding antitoxin AbrB/MazE fold protein